MKDFENYCKIYLNYFKGREDYFACQGKDYYYPIKKSFDLNYLYKHFEDLATFGVYVLTSDSKCNFICIDIDIPKSELDIIGFKDPKEKYKLLKDKLFKILKVFNNEFNIPNNSILLEDTGGRGYHIWLFFKEPLQGEKAVIFFHIIKAFTDFDFEFFPKQPSLNEERRFGNLIKLPLGTHQRYASRSSFFQLTDGKILFFNTLEDNLQYLPSINKIVPGKIDRIIEKNGKLLKSIKVREILSEKLQHTERLFYRKDLEFLFSNCEALNRLKNKAEQGIQFSYKESFHFTNLLLSVEDSYDFIIEKIKNSYGSEFNLVMTQKEIEKINPFYPSSCKKLIDQKICNGFCNEEIKKRNTDPLLAGTSPIAFWLTPIRQKTSIEKDEIFEKIFELNNIKNAYWRLKKYHKDEDSLFYDEFDFEFFEKNLDINLNYISRAIKNRENIPFVGYLKVPIPKKVDENNKMQYRQLTYSTIFDQVVIQAIFDIVAQVLEEDFQDYSYGYRFNINEPQSENIFCDWREYYPKFRNKVLNYLSQRDIKYYTCFDIKGFYDNINQDILLEQLKGYIKDTYILSHIKKAIKMYQFETGINKGVPQGPAYSRILANLYLNDFDKEIVKYSAGYFRYVDDFFIFYRGKEEAERGLKKVFELLNNLELTHSNDEKKRPEILENTNDDKIISKLDSIQYGIFEEFKFIDHLDIKQISDFYDAIERHRVSTTSLTEILEINNKLPSIIYLLSKDIKYSYSIRKKIPAIINYLVHKNLFYPKRLKYIFYKIIDLMVEFNYDITEFYFKLDKAHKVYFLLSLYKIYKRDGKFEKELTEIIRYSLKEDDCFVKGFGIIINDKLRGENKIDVKSQNFLDEILSYRVYFPKLKLFNIVDYFSLPAEKRQIFRSKISDQNLYIEKKYLLANSKHVNVDYIDKVFILNLLKCNSYLLIAECCELFSLIRDDDTLFKNLEKYISGEVNYKDISIYSLTSLIFERYKNSGLAELINFTELYNKIEDTEIKRELTNVITRIRNFSTFSKNDFSKTHRLIDKYNQCYYYNNIDEKGGTYDFLELMPKLKLTEYGYNDLNNLKNTLLDMSYNSILPNLQFEVDSVKEEISIKYNKRNDYKEITCLQLSLNRDDILLALELMEDLYKKAKYFFWKFKKIPLVSINNLLINDSRKEIQFKNFGSILCPFYLIGDQKIRNEDENEIPKMISLLLRELFFQNDLNKINVFCKESSKIDIDLFLSHFIGKMSAKDPSLRYTHFRFNYIITELKKLKLGSNYQISSLYFKERLKAKLADKNHENINWLSICSALHDLYGELAEVYDSINFTNINFYNKTFLNFKLPKGLHYLSKSLLNICLNINEILKSQELRTNFVDLFELLNYYSIFCTEAISFFKVRLSQPSRKSLKLLLEEEVNLTIKGYTQIYDAIDLKSIQALINRDISGQNIFDHSVSFTLKQISFFYLIKSFAFTQNRNDIFIRNESKLKKKFFDLLVYNLLIRLPRIEKEIKAQIENIIAGLKTNQDFHISDRTMELKNDILYFCKDINKIRKKIKCKRYYGKSVKIDRWPPHIYCRSLLKKEYKTTEESLFKIPLSNLFPSSKSKCSWDIINDEIYNLVIPNERINKLLLKLKKGKLFGYKIAYIYSERAKIFWDIILILLQTIVFVALYNLTTTSTKGFYKIGELILGVGILFFIGKLFVDIKYWLPKLYRIIKYLKK